MTRAKPILKSVRKKKKDKKSSKHQPPSHTPPLTLTLIPSTLTKPIPPSSRSPSRNPSATSSTYSASSSASRLFDPRPAPPPTTKTPAAPSPLHRGLTHTELFSPGGPDLHPTYPRKLSTGLPSTPSRQKPSTSTSTARAALTGVQNALGMHRTATPSPAPARLPFVHEKRGTPTLDASSPSLSPSSSSSRASSSTAVATKGADKGARGSHVRVRSLATGALEEQAGGAGVAPPRQQQQVSLVRRAVEAHRNHRRERQKAEMKKSIRVLGQTDPQVVQGYVRVAAGAVAGPGVRPIYRRGSGGEGWL
ncbi:Cyclin-dependent kinase 12 [Neofusicoccum parvum]|nr:Cyclin-dependent kinase 12 [Neofusicoccum parvum]